MNVTALNFMLINLEGGGMNERMGYWNKVPKEKSNEAQSGSETSSLEQRA